MVRRWVLLAIGGVLVIVAIVPDVRSFNGLGPAQGLLLVVGVPMLLYGWLGKRLLRVYQAAGVILLNTLVLLFVVELSIGTVAEVRDRLRPNIADPNNVFSDRHPYYTALPYSEALWREYRALEVAYHPFILWRENPQQGEYVNIDASFRRVVPGAQCDADDVYRVFAFGGSTMIGHGAPDDMTIPAYLRQMLSEQMQRPVCVVNFGSQAWVSTQSVIELLRQLQREYIPDLVIFYDGFNDVAASGTGYPNSHYDAQTLSTAFVIDEEMQDDSLSAMRVLTHRTNIGKRFIDDGVLERPVLQHIERPLSEAPTLAEDVVQTYINNHRIVLAMGDAYGFEVAFFWQPVLGQANKPRTPEEDALVAEFQSSQLLWEPVYAGVQQAANEWPNLHYIADVFDEQEAYLYSDIVHLTPPANEIVAERMIREIQP